MPSTSLVRPIVASIVLLFASLGAAACGSGDKPAPNVHGADSTGVGSTTTPTSLFQPSPQAPTP